MTEDWRILLRTETVTRDWRSFWGRAWRGAGREGARGHPGLGGKVDEPRESHVSPV